jgi:hypothetical protein
MKYLARVTLSAIFLLPLAALSAGAQVWVPGNQPPPPPNQGQQPPGPNQPGPNQQGPNVGPRAIWPPPADAQPSRPPAGAPTAATPAPPPADAADAQPVAMPVKDKDSRLSEEEKLELIRYVSGEFAKAKSALPGGKKTLHVRPGEPLDKNVLLKELTDNGVALSPGDNVQITKLDFGGSDITVELNGGIKGRSWRDRIQISGGGPMPVQTSSTVDDTYGPKGSVPRPGILLQLDFGRPLPEMTPDELKLYLSNVLDFSKQRSAAVQWADAQPPAIREAIAQKHAMVGMDQDQVMAAMGRADRKVREKEPDGTDTEDWIYGTPPGKTVFVRFAHDKVVRVGEYPLPAGATNAE